MIAHIAHSNVHQAGSAPRHRVHQESHGHQRDSVSLGERNGHDDGAKLRNFAFQRHGYNSHSHSHQDRNRSHGSNGNAGHSGGVQRTSEGVFRDYKGREGYDDNFLGVTLGMPKLDDSIKNTAAPLLSDPSRTDLDYTHFSIVMNKERRSPMVTAVNIDGSQYQEFERDGKWAFDSRIDRKYQTGNEAYSNNDIDRGHMVRRRDPMWGPQAEQGQDDTFCYTNSALQHTDLNQHEWLDLENHVLNTATTQGKKITVFTGPVFSPNDPKFDNHGKMDQPTQIPTEFWKVMVWNEPGKGLRGEAFVMSQKDIVNKPASGVDYNDHIEGAEFNTYRVPLEKLEGMTHLDFGDITNNCQSTERIQNVKSLRL